MSIQSFAYMVGMSNNMDQPCTSRDIAAITINTGGLPYCMNSMFFESNTRIQKEKIYLHYK